MVFDSDRRVEVNSLSLGVDLVDGASVDLSLEVVMYSCPRVEPVGKDPVDAE